MSVAARSAPNPVTIPVDPWDLEYDPSAAAIDVGPPSPCTRSSSSASSSSSNPPSSPGDVGTPHSPTLPTSSTPPSINSPPSMRLSVVAPPEPLLPQSPVAAAAAAAEVPTTPPHSMSTSQNLCPHRINHGFISDQSFRISDAGSESSSSSSSPLAQRSSSLGRLAPGMGFDLSQSMQEAGDKSIEESEEDAQAVSAILPSTNIIPATPSPAERGIQALPPLSPVAEGDSQDHLSDKPHLDDCGAHLGNTAQELFLTPLMPRSGSTSSTTSSHPSSMASKASGSGSASTWSSLPSSSTFGQSTSTGLSSIAFTHSYPPLPLGDIQELKRSVHDLTTIEMDGQQKVNRSDDDKTAYHNSQPFVLLGPEDQLARAALNAAPTLLNGPSSTSPASPCFTHSNHSSQATTPLAHVPTVDITAIVAQAVRTVLADLAEQRTEEDERRKQDARQLLILLREEMVKTAEAAVESERQETLHRTKAEGNEGGSKHYESDTSMHKDNALRQLDARIVLDVLDERAQKVRGVRLLSLIVFALLAILATSVASNRRLQQCELRSDFVIAQQAEQFQPRQQRLQLNGLGEQPGGRVQYWPEGAAWALRRLGAL